MTGYVVNVDGAQIASTASLRAPWTPTKTYHRICVASRTAAAVIGASNCVDYGVPPPPPPAPQPPPPPIGTAPSANGTVAPPAGGLVTPAGTWTLGLLWTNGPQRQTLLNGKHAGAGYADALLWFKSEVYAIVVNGEDSRYFKWTAPTWTPIPGDPRGAAPPP